MGQILVVEDEVDLNDLITRQLRQEGHEVYQAFDGEAGVDVAFAISPDLIILDWMLPKLDGLAVCRRIRERSIIPVQMLTARSEEAYVVLGLEVGADDYLTKPFKIRELQARVRAVLRREQFHVAEVAAEYVTDKVLEVGQIRLSLDQRTAFVGDEELELTPKEFDLLAVFVQNPGRAFSRDFLLERIWGDDIYVTDRTVDTHIQRLRKKLGEEADAIRTVWGIGYKLQREG